MQTENTASGDLFYDPFAEQFFDPLTIMDLLVQKYLDGKIEHDYTADNFVSDIEALQMDAVFLSKFHEAEEIASRMRELCAGDHYLQSSIDTKGVMKNAGELQQHDGNDHSTHADNDHDSRSHEDDDDDEEEDEKKSRKSSRESISQYIYRIMSEARARKINKAAR